jgi:hypothetical protein
VGREQAADLGQQVGGDGDGGLAASLGGGCGLIRRDPFLVGSVVQLGDQSLDALLMPAFGKSLFSN